MALLFADPVGSFYSNATQATQGLWTVFTGGTILTSGLPAGNVEPTCIQNLTNGTIAIATPGVGPWTFGWRYVYTGSSGTKTILRFQDVSNAEQFHVAIDDVNGSLTVVNGSGTTLGTSATGILSQNVWNFIEVQGFIDASVGTVTVRVNGAAVLTLTGKNTKAGANASTSKIVLGTGTAPPNCIQDVYLADSTGSYNNTFLGDIRISTYNAAGAGTAGLNQYTPVGAATVWQAVDNVTPDDDTSYASDATPTDRMSVTYAPSAVTGTVVAAIHVSRVRKDDVGTRTVAQKVTSNGVDATGPTISLGTTYKYYTQILETDPNTSAPWTVANFNLAQAGLETLS